MPAVAERTVTLTGHDQYLFREGTHSRLYEKLGAHFLGTETYFAVWAPNAQSVSVVGDWNSWDPRTNPMQGSDSGIWQVRVPNAKPGCVYKFHIVSRNAGYRVDKADPYALRAEEPPIMEHPFYGSWGYQTTGYFAPSNRYGTPQDFMVLVDTLHQAGVGVILDWVPSHFPWDQHGLGFFDGSHLYEHSDPRQGHHPDWASAIFNYGRNEVRSFLASSARFWLDKYHADGLRVDAVASMLYLDYGRKAGEWIPNRHGGRENLEAISFLQFLNETIYRDYPDTQTIAEESTAWPQVSRPTYLGGLGFGMKWNMGWMHDTLAYMKNDPVFRKYRHDELTFSLWYAFHENFVLPLSHDEVVHGKGSLIGRMPGDAWQQFANLRALFSYMWSHPGKKLVFMGGEFGQRREWNHDDSLEWHAIGMDNRHEGVQRWVSDLNKLYKNERALHARDFSQDGFRWLQRGDWEQSVIAFQRQAPDAPPIVVVCNFTPVPRTNYRVGVPHGGHWVEALNSDAPFYGGSGMGNFGGVEAAPMPYEDMSHSLNLTLPPLSALLFKP